MSYKKKTLDELIILSQQSDLKALEELIRREQRNVFTMFSYLVKRREIVSDLTQETLLKVAKNITNLKNHKCYKHWLNQIVTNTYYDYLRKKQRSLDIVPFEDTNFEQICDTKSKPNEKCLCCELEQVIKNAIKELPQQFKVAIILREFQGLSYEEIAKITKSSVGTVKSRIARARTKLQCCLKGYV